MKKIYIIISILLLSYSIIAKENTNKENIKEKKDINKKEKKKDHFDITVKIDKIKHKNGTLRLKLCKYSKSFPIKKNIFKSIIVFINSKKTEVTFKNIKKGEYAITVHHDENGNGETDTNFIGIPNEGLGLSNNAKGFFGPPSFKDASFKLNKNKILKINMRY